MRQRTVTKLTDGDLDVLLNVGEYFQIGSTQIPIRPLGLRDRSIILKSLQTVLGGLKDNGIDVMSGDPAAFTENWPTIVGLAMDKVPDLVAHAAGMDADDVEDLPFSVLLGLVKKIVDVNLESHGTMRKNWKALVEAAKALTTPSSESEI